jgi:hypothetical protein
VKTVYHAADPVMAGFIEGVLRHAGIDAHVFQAGLYGAAGELPPTECWARVVVVDDAQAAQARAVILGYLEPGPLPDASGWTCSRCGEAIEAQFTQCWQCGGERGP